MAKKKNVDEDDDDLPQKPRRGGDDGEETEEPGKLSFRERLLQAKTWAEENQTKALIILGCVAAVFLLLFALLVWRIISVRNRPTLQQAVEAFEFGAYPQAQVRAESVLRYAKESETEKRIVAFYILGASLLKLYEPTTVAEKETYLLAAANHLKEAYTLGFPLEYKTPGLLAYGKALYLTDSITQAIEILQEAEGRPQQDNKTVNWLLTNVILRHEEPDYNLAMGHCDQFLADSTLTQMEMYRGKLLRANILMKLGRFTEANKAFDQVPPLDELEAYQEFICAQLLMEEGRQLRTLAIQWEKQLFMTDSPFTIRSTAPRPTVTPSQEMETSSEPRTLDAPPDTEMLDDSQAPPQPGDATFELIQNSSASSLKRKPAPLPPQFETPAQLKPTRIRQAVEHRDTPPGKIVQARFQNAESENVATLPRPIAIKKSFTTDDVKELRRESFAKYQEAILRLEMSKNADAAEFQYTKQSILLQGICFEEMGEFTKAKDQYRELISTFPESNEAIAAAFFRSEIFRKSGQFDAALTGHHWVVNKLTEKGVYLNPILTRKEIMQRIDYAIGELITLREYEDAFTFLAVYESITSPHDAVKLKALGYEGWGKMLQRNANAASFEEREKLLAEARDKYRKAGREYALYAKYEMTSQQFTNLLWASAENYRAGKDYIKAIPKYREYLKHNVMLRQAETLAILGQMYFDLDMLDDAISIYDEYLELYPDHPMLYQVRLIKSYAHAEKKEWDQAKTMLLENLSGILGPDAPEYRDSIFALGKMYYTDGEREKAIATLEDAVYLHPEASQAAHAYYMIAQSYMNRVGDEQKRIQTSNLTTARERASVEMQKARQLARDNFQRTRTLLGSREMAIPLTPAEEKMQMICYFEIAKLELLLGQLDAAIDSFNLAQNRFQERPETLDALIQVAMIYRRLGRDTQARETVQKGKVLLQKLTASKAFPAGYRFNETEWNELLAWGEKTGSAIKNK